jgi:hypothetical protein
MWLPVHLHGPVRPIHSLLLHRRMPAAKRRGHAALGRLASMPGVGLLGALLTLHADEEGNAPVKTSGTALRRRAPGPVTHAPSADPSKLIARDIDEPCGAFVKLARGAGMAGSVRTSRVRRRRGDP